MAWISDSCDDGGMMDQTYFLNSLLPRSLLEGDVSGESKRIITAMHQCFAAVRAIVDYYRRHLKDLIDPVNCPDEFIELLGVNVGLDEGAIFSVYMSKDEFRKLIRVAVQVWKEKGETEAFRDLLGAFVTPRPVIVEWPMLAHVTGMSYPPFVWSSAKNESHIWVQDPTSSIDRNLIEGTVQALRPIGQQIILSFCHIAENWERGFSQWDVDQGVDTDIEAGEHSVTLEVSAHFGGTEVGITSNLTGSGSLAEYDLFFVAKPYIWDTSVNFFEIRWHVNTPLGTAYYACKFSKLNEAKAHWALFQLGVPHGVGVCQLGNGEVNFFQLSTRRSGTANKSTLSVNGKVLFSYSSSALPEDGNIGIYLASYLDCSLELLDPLILCPDGYQVMTIP